MDVHPPHGGIHTWRDFWIHLGTITIGLLIAISLEQGVEWLHRLHERHALQHDLRAEAEQNRQIIARDLEMAKLKPWFDQAMQEVTNSTPQQGKLQVTLPPAPCLPGSMGTDKVRYFAPSEAVWTTAKESGLVSLLPVEESRVYARLDHNYELLGKVRDHVADGCNAIVAMRRRFARLSGTDGGTEVWTMGPEQAEALGKQAAQTQTDIQGLLFRLRWSDVYEEAIVRGENEADVKMMFVNQERFEEDTALPK